MDEISDLQKALNDAQTYLFDERQHVLRLYGENDELKSMLGKSKQTRGKRRHILILFIVQELEDRRKIQQLLAITQPRHEEITYFKSRAPERIHRYLPKDSYVKTSSSCLPSIPPLPVFLRPLSFYCTHIQQYRTVKRSDLKQITSPHSIVVSTSRCGRDDAGSIPAVGIFFFFFFFGFHSLN